MQTTPSMPTPQTAARISSPAQMPVAPDPEQQRRERAIQRIRGKNVFKIHLVAYLFINAWLVVMWAMSGVGYFWPIFPIVAWGAGVAVHGYCVYGANTVTEAQIEREMERLP